MGTVIKQHCAQPRRTVFSLASLITEKSPDYKFFDFYGALEYPEK